jgi:hypothetical protein
VLGVRIDVVLVAKEALAVLLRPACVAILLAQLGRLLLPLRRRLSAFTASFSSRLLRCFGTGTIVASTRLGFHLHFEVRKGLDQIVDPYSEGLWLIPEQ